MCSLQDLGTINRVFAACCCFCCFCCCCCYVALLLPCCCPAAAGNTSAAAALGLGLHAQQGGVPAVVMSDKYNTIAATYFSLLSWCIPSSSTNCCCSSGWTGALGGPLELTGTSPAALALSPCCSSTVYLHLTRRRCSSSSNNN